MRKDRLLFGERGGAYYTRIDAGMLIIPYSAKTGFSAYFSHMDKARRHELKMSHYKRRLRDLRLVGKDGNFYGLRTSGKPCSCMLCDPHKYDPSGRHSTNRRAPLDEAP